VEPTLLYSLVRVEWKGNPYHGRKGVVIKMPKADGPRMFHVMLAEDDVQLIPGGRLRVIPTCIVPGCLTETRFSKRAFCRRHWGDIPSQLADEIDAATRKAIHGMNERERVEAKSRAGGMTKLALAHILKAMKDRGEGIFSSTLGAEGQDVRQDPSAQAPTPL
jgi:hypothetical protein